jgi:hypothetical protein
VLRDPSYGSSLGAAWAVHSSRDLDIEAVGGRGTTNSYVTFTVTKLTSPIPDYMTYIFAALFLAIVLTAYLRQG